MYARSAELYDLIYAAMKDYAAEARWLAALLRELSPGAGTLLDVACGTGEHARWLAAQHGLRVDGIDLDPQLLSLAAAKNPGGAFRCADMTDFDLGDRYDVVTCLFGSIAYARSLEALGRTARCLALHLDERGVVLVEPFLAPGSMQHGRVTARAIETAEVSVCRMSHAIVDGRLARVSFEYLVGGVDGIERRSEVHELGLYSGEELVAALRSAGLIVEVRPDGLDGRPLYIGRRG